MELTQGCCIIKFAIRIENKQKCTEENIIQGINYGFKKKKKRKRNTQLEWNGMEIYQAKEGKIFGL